MNIIHLVRLTLSQVEIVKVKIEKNVGITSTVKIDELYKHVSVIVGWYFSFCLVLSTHHATISSGDVHSYTYHGNVMVATRLNSNKLSRCQ